VKGPFIAAGVGRLRQGVKRIKEGIKQGDDSVSGAISAGERRKTMLTRRAHMLVRSGKIEGYRFGKKAS
jgi:hypothetical protein